MREVIQKVYSIEELTERAKEKAFYKWMELDYYDSRENTNSLNKFCDMLNVKVLNYEYGGMNNYIKWELMEDEELKNLHGLKLKNHILNNYNTLLIGDCPLTGYCIDIEIIAPIKQFIQTPSEVSMECLVGKCLSSWLEACQKDYDNFFSLESFVEMSDVNEWEYFEDGTFY